MFHTACGDTDVTKTLSLPSNVAPRGFNVRQAAEYWGCSVGTFKKLVRIGIAPPPLKLGGLERNIYDRVQLDEALARAGGYLKAG
jgi:hypothetical protein